MTHFSINENILWYIDSVNITQNNIFFNGWIFHKEYEIKNILIENSSILINQFERLDVNNVYPQNKFSNFSGIQLQITKHNLYKNLEILLSNGEKLKIESLEKFYIYYLGFSTKQNTSLVVIDNFYNNPNEIREFAINNLNYTESGYHKGKRSTEKFILKGTKEKFEKILGKQIYNWNKETYANGIFQFCVSSDPIVYHTDSQSYAGIVFLSPNAPLSTGTATFQSKITGIRKFDETNYTEESFQKTFKGYGNEINFYDNTSFELVDKVGNVFNRLVLFDAKCIHAATEYYGTNISDSRFFQLFFFDIK